MLKPERKLNDEQNYRFFMYFACNHVGGEYWHSEWEVLKMTIVKAASEQNVYSQIFRPITTARLQVAEKNVACTAGAIISLSIFL